ncbi:MAG: Trk system potassium transporter TrkA [Firmicutes bacterium]|nr:Trk system potassium transporter TrkA [Bacillota bacterium]
MKILIVGAGKLGMKVAGVLLGSNHDITIMDISPAQLKRASSQMDVMTVNGNAKDIRSLKGISIDTFDYLIATTGSDETNIVIAAFAKKLGCRKVLARVRDPEHMDQFTFIKDTMSIDGMVNPDLSITQEIFKYLSEKYTLSNGIFSTGGASLIEFKVVRFPELIGKTMPEIHEMLPNMLVAAISRNGKIIIPNGNTSVMENDSVYIMGKREPIIQLNTRVHEKGKYTNLQKIMIIGGGKTGFYLAKKLSDFGMSVKIIEYNLERCHYLSDHLKGVMVLNGDATDMTFLEDENLDQMDAVVTCTGFDEDNLLLALSAKSHNVKHVIAKVSRTSYAEIITDLGIDMALNPLDITTSEIVRFVQGYSRVITSQIIQGQAEIMEFVATPGTKILGKPLGTLGLPEGMLFAAIHRGDQVIIPGGRDTIQAGDRGTMIYLLSEI